MSTITGNANVFFRGKWKGLEASETYYVDIPCPLEKCTDLPWLVNTAREMGVPKGSFQTGIYEIQTDLGIWSRDDQMRLDTDTPRKLAKAKFKTWEEMEAAEELSEHHQHEVVYSG
jgi:hypothetical protein